MYVDVSQPPPPLPTPQLTELAPGLSLLQPLSRRGHGPGLIILVPNSPLSSLAIEEGIPSPLVKWAEEGYVVVEVQEKELSDSVLGRAVEAISKSDKCEPKGVVGLVAYNAKSWNRVAPSLASISEIPGVVIYADVSEVSSLADSSVPRMQHLAGKMTSTLKRTEQLTAYDYPAAKSSSFAIPFQEGFHHSAEAVSHTRNLAFLKRRMNGPYFDLETIWDEHTYFEFENRSVEHTMATMVQEPYVNHIPTMTGGIGRDRLSSFYQNHFVWKNPADTELELISRTVGTDRVVDEFIYKFTHDSEVDWLIPGIPPTGKKLEIPFTAVVNVRGDRLYHEHIAWDQGTVLVQLGLIPEYVPFPYLPKDGRTLAAGKAFEVRLPVAGRETAIKMRDKNILASNGMFEFGVREVQGDTSNM